MLSTDIKSQLTDVFAKLTKDVTLVISPSSHEKQAELTQFLESVAECSSKVAVTKGAKGSASIEFEVHVDDSSVGVQFQAIPTGHEFTSLILAILNASGLGKLPDEGIIRRIKGIQKGLEIKTYMSLTCENCPDVVQALNQIAIFHGSLTHRTIDGSYAQEELSRLNIQGVPAVFIGDELIHSGRSNLSELLAKLEAKFGSSDVSKESLNHGHFDVAVIGGGPAGAAAAIYSVRKGLRTVLIAEKIGGQMQETKGIENFASVTYTEGPQLSANLEQHLKSYPVVLLENRRVESMSGESNHKIILTGGEELTAASTIVATGAKWRELGVPGEKEYLGRGVAFCPHCDGPYYKDRPIAVIGGGNSGVEAAIDLAGICSQVTLIEYGDSLKADQVLVTKLHSLSNVSVITNAKTSEILGDGQKVNKLIYQDRSTDQTKSIDLDGVFVQIGLSPNSAFLKNIVETTKQGEIIVDPKGRTSKKGIYAAGDVTTIPFKQIIIAMGDGAKVALTAFEDRMRSEVA
ncbi:MAG: alkyl hydroperoxide reductase subunit F [Proteobacteria bacterium]|nr:alkyl hydroperoxide reductase subunit F [Pseudomonadota bacterium]